MLYMVMICTNLHVSELSHRKTGNSCKITGHTDKDTVVLVYETVCNL